MSDRFYTPTPLAPGEFLLDGPQAHHLATVRRFSTGDHVTLFNGDGNDYPAEVVSTDRKRAVLTVFPGQPTLRELPFRLELATAMPKGDRGDFLIEKLTELGVTRFTPLQTARSIVQPKEARLDKLHQAVIEASKQCGRNVLMRVDPPIAWTRFQETADLPPVRVILHPPLPGTQPQNLTGLSTEAIRTGGIVFAVGPEGGFNGEELAEGEAAGWIRVSLGPRILRVETAAIASASWAAMVGK
jgi:16S rRNA (uracil1498-N3)-methyltransferase